jgi:hypothetical protein
VTPSKIGVVDIDALAQSMDAVASASDHVEVAARVMLAWSEGRLVKG